MTDMKISDGAVEAAARIICCGPERCLAVGKCTAIDPPAGPIARRHLTAALRYYAEHPEELPQEVRDAVRGRDNE